MFLSLCESVYISCSGNEPELEYALRKNYHTYVLIKCEFILSLLCPHYKL